MSPAMRNYPHTGHNLQLQALGARSFLTVNFRRRCRIDRKSFAGGFRHFVKQNMLVVQLAYRDVGADRYVNLLTHLASGNATPSVHGKGGGGIACF